MLRTLVGGNPSSSPKLATAATHVPPEHAPIVGSNFAVTFGWDTKTKPSQREKSEDATYLGWVDPFAPDSGSEESGWKKSGWEKRVLRYSLLLNLDHIAGFILLQSHHSLRSSHHSMNSARGLETPRNTFATSAFLFSQLLFLECVPHNVCRSLRSIVFSHCSQPGI
jgi:hypothetical protein